MKHPLSVIVISLTLVCSYTYAATFKVIAPGTKGDVQVSINGANTKLTASDPDLPYYTGNADLPNGAKYKYIVDGAAESFDRTLDSSRTSTRNDFFNRPVTYANIPELPWPIKDEPQWTRGSRGPIWDTNYITSIFVTGAQADMNQLILNLSHSPYSAKITYIGPDDVYTFSNCAFQLHKPGKKHNNAKQSWAWSLPEGQSIDNRNWFKLRHMEEDPTQIREKLYADILEAMGTYANEANMVRLYINGVGFGTFNMLDDVIEYSYINAMFYNGKPPAQMGPLYDGASGADFGYHTTDDAYYSFQPNPQSPENSLAIKPITQQFNETDVTNDAALAEFGKSFDIERYLRFMVMEYLTADWDGYWMEQTNDGAYQDPNDKKWYYLGQDYDATFGVNLDVPDGKDFVNKPYTDWVQRFPGGILINRLLQNTNMKNKFETYLKDTVQILFNNVTLTNRILAYHDFILPDLEWDRGITQLSKGINYGWTFPQVTQNLWQGVNAPNNNGGGATWGLIEWIIAKADAVKKQYNLTITTTPVGPPTQNSSSSPASSQPSSNVSVSGTQSLVSNPNGVASISPSKAVSALAVMAGILVTTAA